MQLNTSQLGKVIAKTVQYIDRVIIQHTALYVVTARVDITPIIT